MIIKIFLSLLSIIFSLVMIYITQINYKNKILGKLNYLLWIGIWVMSILVSIELIVDVYFEENYKIDIFYILSVISILFLLILNYFLFLKLNILEKKINTLIRSKSLKDIFERIK